MTTIAQNKSYPDSSVIWAVDILIEPKTLEFVKTQVMYSEGVAFSKQQF